MVKKPAGKGAKASPRSNSKLNPAAVRALEEAALRRKARKHESVGNEKEVGGRGGADPVRYGDWEKDGIVSDF
jgi:hypothetical protein